MTANQVVSEAEGQVRLLAAELIEIRKRECLLCYVWRMLEFGCTGLRWATRYRDLRAPQATAMQHRLGRVGGFCDCEIFANGFRAAPEHWIVPEPVVDGDVVYHDEPYYPEVMPPCRGARRGSIQGCSLWVRQYRPRW